MLIAVLVIAACAALVALGVVVIVRWGAGPPTPAAASGALPRRLTRYAAVMAAAGIGAGVLAAGAGGRLAMRVLAATSPEVHGSLTEAGEEIGDITAGGTLGFIVFVGPAAGVLTAGLYALLYPLLPRGRAGGVVLGVTLLVLAGSRLEPLRDDNFDFALLGPDWLSVLLFAALAVFQGLLGVALAGLLARGRPLAPPLPGPRLIAAGRVAAVVVVLAALPAFIAAVADILTA